MAACNQLRSNSNNWPESQRKYGNSSLNATMILVRSCGLGRMRPGFRWLWRKKLALRGVGFDPAPELLNRIDKLLHVLEPPMHRGVSQVGDFIDIAQFLQHFRADLGR